jgi:hypothetical protein
MPLSIQDVRDFMFDRTAMDNELDMDLSFTDEEIGKAMKRAARDANDVPPYSFTVSADNLPDDTNIYLYATAEHLYLSKMQQLMRGDADYTAGGVTGSITAKRIVHFKELVSGMRTKWEVPLKSAKITANVRKLHYYGD